MFKRLWSLMSRHSPDSDNMFNLTQSITFFSSLFMHDDISVCSNIFENNENDTIWLRYKNIKSNKYLNKFIQTLIVWLVFRSSFQCTYTRTMMLKYPSIIFILTIATFEYPVNQNFIIFRSYCCFNFSCAYV